MSWALRGYHTKGKIPTMLHVLCVCVCVCVCVRARARAHMQICVYACVHVSACKCMLELYMMHVEFPSPPTPFIIITPLKLTYFSQYKCVPIIYIYSTPVIILKVSLVTYEG